MKRFNAFVNSRFAWRSNFLRLRGNGTNKPITVTVVPRFRHLLISTRERERGNSYLENNNTHLAGNLPATTGEATSFIEDKNGAHRRLDGGRCGDSGALREGA